MPSKKNSGPPQTKGFIYWSVLENRPITFITKFAWISLWRPGSLLTFCPHYYVFGPVILLSIAWMSFLPGGLLRFTLCLRNPCHGLLIGTVTYLLLPGWLLSPDLWLNFSQNDYQERTRVNTCFQKVPIQKGTNHANKLKWLKLEQLLEFISIMNFWD